MNDTTPSNLIERLEQLNAIGVALSAEKDINSLLEVILLAAKKITNADAGTLYRVHDMQYLTFEIMRTDSLGFALGGTTGKPIMLPPIRLYNEAGLPNNSMVVAYAVLNDQTVNIEDAYTVQGFDLPARALSTRRTTTARNRSSPCR